MSCLGRAPTTWDLTSPSVKRAIVGMLMIPYLAAIEGAWSMLTLTTFTLPPYSVAIFSSSGCTRRQGLHHSAQKSTMTGVSAASTTSLNSCSVTSCILLCLLSVGLLELKRPQYPHI